MAKVAVVVMSDTETHADTARVANALTTVYEFKEAGEEATLVFSGAGTRWIGKLSDPDHRLHRPSPRSRTRCPGRARRARSPSA